MRKIVYTHLHSSWFRERLETWLSCHPRIHWWKSGNDTILESVTMSTSAWRDFCKDMNYNYKEL